MIEYGDPLPDGGGRHLHIRSLWERHTPPKPPAFRHELKYLINEGDHVLLKSRMAPYFSLDPNAKDGEYMIRSLYFDDFWNSAAEEKDMGVFDRKKYRIRIYNFKDDYIRLERKTKRGNYIYKESGKLTREEVYRILEGDYGFLLRSPSPLCREFYVECMCYVMRPRVIVDYDREPYVLDAGTVRITFDKKVRAGIFSYDIFDPKLPTIDCLEPGKMVLEVKYTEFLPRIVQELIPTRAAEYTALSKYVLCYEKTRYLREQDYWEETVNRWDNNTEGGRKSV